MARTYAVTWRTGTGPFCAGQLELDARITLDGVDAGGGRVTTDLGAHVAGVRLATNGDRLRGRRTLVVARRGQPSVSIAPLDGPGTANEVLERLALRARPGRASSR